MKYVLWFEQISRDDVPKAGGKGANLGEMFGAGMPVPPGFVVTTTAFDKLMKIGGLGEKIDQIIKRTNVEDTGALFNASKAIKEMIVSQEMPDDVKAEVADSYKTLSYDDKVQDAKMASLMSAGADMAFVAVRSSATAEDLPGASFAGQQATFLNVRGTKDLLQSVRECWASLFEPRAIFYRSKNKFGSASIAVVVQRMVNSDKSGIMFTTDPVSGDDSIIIEATWGLGEYIVLGEVSPDHYIIDKQTDSVRDMKIGRKEKALVRDPKTGKSVEWIIPRDKSEAEVLTADELAKLIRYGHMLEEHYDHAQDVEFAIEKGVVRIVQTRAVTTKGKKSDVKIEGRELVRGRGASPGIATGKVKIVRGMEDIEKIMKGDILVTVMTSPDLVPAMSRSGAIVTDNGGSNCHAAIVSREMGIPAIVGTETATSVLKEGELVTVDAYSGIVYEGSVAVDKPDMLDLGETGETRTKVKVNMVFADKLEVASKTDGVGLLRIEHMITKFGVHPAKLMREGRREEYVNLLVDGIRPIAEAYSPKPVWVRTLDARSDEFRHLQGGEDEPHEDNPMLGWHGLRRSLDEPELFKAELEAIKRLHGEGLTNVRAEIPFVISVEELRRANQIAAEVGMGEGFKFGLMVETPACALDIEEFCREGIEFASFGTNDLTQLTLGMDRNNEKIMNIGSEFHPSVIRQMKEVIEVCARYGVESSICGEAGSSPEMAKILVRAGIKSVSCNIDAIDKIRAAVYQAERESGYSERPSELFTEIV
ncbi:MAG: phosphoenolpyruvate synthase [Candidatus Aenigmarchaeota archaeon]|nr:phosphoenolpyruvate synthase [Candidatus Aenigmarchaeota archaeon]